MKRLVFEGSAVAIITPFSDKGIDFDKLAQLIAFHIENGTDGIVICGTTGEASTMPDSEHMAAVAFTVKEVKGRIPVIAGVGSNDTAHGIDLVREATKLGADALLNTTPYYNKTSQEGLYRHFTAMAKETDLPVILYNVPVRTALNIAPETIRRLSEIPNIVGVKECNLLQLPDSAALCGEDMVFYSGEDGVVIPLLSLGGRGVISVVANLLPSEVSQMVHLYLEGKHAEALRIQLDLLPLIHALFSDVSPIPIKEAMNILGWNVGFCRMPLCEMSPEGHAALERVLGQYTFYGLNR